MTTALITVYLPGEEVRHNVQCIARQVDRVYLCDNSPVSNQTLFEALSHNICYTFFGKNLGISAAFNRILKDPGNSWQADDYVFFFDQDSLVGPEHIQTLLRTHQALVDSGAAVGCLGPAYFDTSSGQVEIPRTKTQLSPKNYAVSSIITSSMLCTYRSLRDVGFWNEHVFLDMADWDLCWRMTSAGKLCCLTEEVILQHSLGSGKKKIGPFQLRVGQPFREYYQIRESLYLIGRRYTPIKYRIRFLAMYVIRTPLHLIFLDNRRERLQYILRGCLDFFRKKTGAMAP